MVEFVRMGVRSGDGMRGSFGMQELVETEQPRTRILPRHFSDISGRL